MSDNKNNTPESTEKGKQPEESAALQEQLKNVEDTGSVTTDNGRHVIHCLTIIGQIEGQQNHQMRARHPPTGGN